MRIFTPCTSNEFTLGKHGYTLSFSSTAVRRGGNLSAISGTEQMTVPSATGWKTCLPAYSRSTPRYCPDCGKSRTTTMGEKAAGIYNIVCLTSLTTSGNGEGSLIHPRESHGVVSDLKKVLSSEVASWQKRYTLSEFMERLKGRQRYFQQFIIEHYDRP